MARILYSEGKARHNGMTRKLRSELEGTLQISTKEELHYKTMNFVIEKILRPNPCILTKKLIVFPFCANEHWTTTFVFNASWIDTFRSETTNETRNLVPTFLRYCPYQPSQGICGYANAGWPVVPTQSCLFIC